MKTAQLHAV